MTKSRTWTLGTALVVVLVFVAGWLLVISPKRSTAATLHTQVGTLVAQNQSTEENIRQLKLEQQQLPAQQAQLAAIQQQLPAQPLLPSLLRQVSALAYNSGASLSSISPAPTILAVPGDTGVSYIPVVVNGDFTHLKSFLLALENNKRSVLVTGFTIAPVQAATGTGGAVPAGELTLALQTRVFMAGVTGTGSGGAAPTPSATASGATTTGSTTSGATPTSAASPASGG